jgi:hypothetical protein
MATAPNRPRNTRTANGLKKGIHIEWDAPKPKPVEKAKFDPILFLDRCLADKQAYSQIERKAFFAMREEILNLRADVQSLRDQIFDLSEPK